MTPRLCTGCPPLRSAIPSFRPQPTFFIASSNYSNTPPSSKLPDVQKRPLNHSSSPSPPRATISRQASQLSHTPTSTSTTTPTLAAASPTPNPTAATATATASGTPHRLDWNTFLHLRKVRRRYNLAASIGSSIGTTMMGVSVLSQQDLDALGGQMFGLDPFVVLGLTTAGFGAIGWLAGPFVGNAVFNAMNRRFKGQIAEKEKEFYQRVKRYRVDPSSQSFSNPVPDYYGEKIGSVKDYRQWLKDQRAYNKKRQSFL